MPLIKYLRDLTETFAEKSSYARLLFLLFILCLSAVAIYEYPISRMIWSPPPSSEWHSETGYFGVQYSCYKTGCPQGFTFHSQKGNVLIVNCEPMPPINECLYGYFGPNMEFSQKNIRILYYKTLTHYNVLLGVYKGHLELMSPKERIEFIRHTSVSRGKNRPYTRYTEDPFERIILIFIEIPSIVLFLIFIGLCFFLKLSSKNKL